MWTQTPRILQFAGLHEEKFFRKFLVIAGWTISWKLLGATGITASLGAENVIILRRKICFHYSISGRRKKLFTSRVSSVLFVHRLHKFPEPEQGHIHWKTELQITWRTFEIKILEKFHVYKYCKCQNIVENVPPKSLNSLHKGKGKKAWKHGLSTSHISNSFILKWHRSLTTCTAMHYCDRGAPP